MAKVIRVAGLALIAGLLVAGCMAGQPGKVYDYSRAGFTPDHSR